MNRDNLAFLQIILNNLDVIFFIFLVFLGFTSGTIAEKSHYRSIKKREENLMHIPVVNSGDFIDNSKEIENVYFISGSCVVALDYFKMVFAAIKQIFGGRIQSYETLIDRGRREAILRLKEKAASKNVDVIINLRIETSSIGQNAGQKGGIGSVEVFAYATAITYKK
ncbi:MAG: YbjQ family protein [Candidatus Goldbacteria bacterium]|nr:YbjQ family protein [Candidatus Goldiibacteriota bacterium]